MQDERDKEWDRRKQEERAKYAHTAMGRAAAGPNKRGRLSDGQDEAARKRT